MNFQSGNRVIFVPESRLRSSNPGLPRDADQADEIALADLAQGIRMNVFADHFLPSATLELGQFSRKS